jgi:hypothetical protein
MLLGREGIVVENAIAQLQIQGYRLFGGTGIEDVRRTFAERSIDAVIMGAGIDLDSRLEIVREIFRLSSTTTVHMKDAASGREGFLTFVGAILRGLTDLPSAPGSTVGS